MSEDMFIERIKHIDSIYRYVHRAICPDDPPAVPQPKPTYPYRTIGAVFNHESFYANCQVLILLLVHELFSKY